MNNMVFEAVVKLRTSVIEFLGTAIILALGINIFSSGLGLWLNLTTTSLLLIGAGLCFTGLAAFLIRLGPTTRRVMEYEGFVVFDPKEDNKIIPIKRYEFGEALSASMVALCTENKAIGRIWSASDLQVALDERSAAHQIVIEAIEYYAINKLSVLLTDYFNYSQNGIEADKLVVYEREDVPRILLKNRFLEMFSRPMEEREAFMEEDTTESDKRHELAEDHEPAALTGGSTRKVDFELNMTESGGRVVMQFGPNGEIFEFFELTLPTDTVIDRSADRTLEIKNPHFTLKIGSSFQGYGANLPTDFEHYYLGRHYMSVRRLHCGLKIEVNFKLRAFLTGSGRQYHQWIDRFIEEVESGFSFSRFLEDVSWEAAHTSTIATINSQKTPLGTPDFLH